MTLFSPLRLRTVTLPNRIVVPAMVTRLSGEDGHVNPDIVDRYVRFAVGNPGLLVVEAMAVHSAKSGPLLRVSDDAFVPGLRNLVDRCRAVSDTVVFPQIIHFLKVARNGWRQTVDMLDTNDLKSIVEAYATAAARVRTCGFHGVELHMAHAYTLSSFLSRRNPRKDAYGGSIENRLRLPLEVLAAVRNAVGEDFPVGVRFVGEECIKGGYTQVEAALIAQRLAEEGADYISLSAGGKFEDAIHKDGEPLYPYTGYSGDRCMPGAAYPDAANAHLAFAVRHHLRAMGLSTPVVAAGKISDLDTAHRLLSDGTADMIGMARALLADPDIPRKWREGREESVVRCLYGNVCKALDENFRKVVCTLWPKGSLQAPLEETGTLPLSFGAPEVRASGEGGRVLLTWTHSPTGESRVAPYGYEVLRRVQGIWVHCATVRGKSHRYEDNTALVGLPHTYAVRAFGLSGDRSTMSDPVEVFVR